jgi:undecaprenyl-diphosphatase
VTPLEALLLGVIEGLTEFLPVSSTGHLTLALAALGHNDDAAKAMSIVIQLGAVVAVMVFYRARLFRLAKGFVRGDRLERRLLLSLALGFLPAALLGFAFHKPIKAILFGPNPIAYALIVGGVVMIAVETWGRHSDEETDVSSITPKQALAVGFFQCFALWPGTSRSMSTIVGGQLVGLPLRTAAEFSFLLSIPMLGAATAFDLLKHGRELLETKGALAIGLVSAFVVAMLAIAGFLRMLQRFGMRPFGVYRIALGIVVLVLAARGFFDG